MASNAMNGAADGTLHISYGDHPSRAWLRSDHQFVLLKALWGAVRSQQIDLAQRILADVERLEADINAEPGDPATHQALKLRAIRFDEAHTSFLLQVELLHARQVRAARTEPQLCAAFHHGETHYGGQLGMVVVTITALERPSKHDDPLADSCYEEVRAAFAW